MEDLDGTPLGPEALFRELRSAGTTSEEHARKIQLASSAWRSSTTRVPRKGQFILEWLLERLLKTRNDDSACVRLSLYYWGEAAQKLTRFQGTQDDATAS